MTKKVETAITLANGGMHSPARYRAFKKIILENDYKKARLYQFILTGSTSPEAYNKAADGIARLLRDNGIRCTGKGAWEVDEDKGLHFHFFVLVEAQYGKVDHWLNPSEDGPLKTMLRKLGLKVHIAPPQNRLHARADGTMPLYQYVSKSGPKLEDALVRVSYIYKKRSKDDSMKRIYYSTRDRAAKPEASPEIAALKIQAADSGVLASPEIAEQEILPSDSGVSTTTNEDIGNEMVITNLTPAGFTYLAKLYEQAVDQRMDVGAIHAYLTRKGVAVTRAEVIHHLEHVFSFPGYAAANPAKPMLTYAEIDALMRVPARRLPSSSDRSAVLAIDRFPTPRQLNN